MLASEMDLDRQVRERREEQEKTTYDMSHATMVSPSHVPDEETEYFCEGQPIEDFNFLETHINVDADWPPYQHKDN